MVALFSNVVVLVVLRIVVGIIIVGSVGCSVGRLVGLALCSVSTI